MPAPETGLTIARIFMQRQRDNSINANINSRRGCYSSVVQSRVARLMLLVLFFATMMVAAFLFWRGETRGRTETAQAQTFDNSAQSASRALLDLRAAQQAYVAAGQDGEFWARKVAQHVAALRSGMKTLKAESASPEAQRALDRTSSAIEDFTRVDKRALDYVRSNQRLLASDVIYGDGLELSEVGLTSLEQARTDELQARESAALTFRRRQMFALAAAAAGAMLTVVLLLPAAPAPASASTISLADRATAPRPAEPVAPLSVDLPREPESEGWSQSRQSTAPVENTEPAIVPVVPAAAAAEVESSAPPEALAADVQPDPPQPTTDFAGVASLCVDLARVVDTRALPALLDRAASLLDASGIILWIADPDGRELNPIFAQGYPLQLVNRLGTISRDAENATAAAFRTSLLQTVKADAISEGAIAAPLVTPGGCVGVMAAEVRHNAERQDMMLAAATIVAAQLATLMGPPSARPHSVAKSG
jgi:hypothetical protein